MPTYEYHCPSCEREVDVIHLMKDCDKKHMCSCGTVMHRQISVVSVKPPPDSGWEHENQGRGRCFTQFKAPPGVKPGDPRCARYFRSQTAAIEAAKREGYEVTRAR